MNALKNIVTYTPSNYDLLKIKPDSRLTGNVYANIINCIYSTRKEIKDRITHENTTKYNGIVKLHMNNPITYEIMFDGDNKKTTPTFCFGIPTDNAQYIKQRVQGILPQSTLTFEKDYAEMFGNCYIAEYNYLKDSMLSLKVSDNNFLQAMLNLKNDIDKGERILFQVSILPISDMWKSFQDDKWDKARSGKDVVSKYSLFDKSLEFANDTVNSILGIMDEIMEHKPNKKDASSLDKKEKAINMAQYSSASKTKKLHDGFSVTIKAYIVCDSKLKARAYSIAIETAMRELEEDNRLIVGGLKSGSVKRGVSVKTFMPLGGNIMSSKEVSSIVNIPNQKLQREFKIDSVNVRQVSAPKECRDSSGGIRIGTMELYGEKHDIYFPKGRDFLAMPKFSFAGMGSGKSTWLLNYANDVLNSGQSLVDINFVNKCELAYALKEAHKDHIIIDLSDENNLPAFMIPEIRILDTDTNSQKKKKAGNVAVEIEYFINSVTSTSTGDITTRMGQYLICAAKIVFIYNDMRISTVFDILEDKNIRDKWIDKAIESEVYNEEDYEIRKLRQLDDDKSGKLVDGILDRYSVLMRHEVFQQMLSCDNAQFNFIDIMDSGKSISICMPEREFTNKAVKDIIITYLMCRLRIAMISRVNVDDVVHVLIDEAHHLNKSLNVISNSIAEPRKYGVAFCFCCHYFNQLGDELKEAALSVGGHFMLLKGVGESAFESLKSKIGEDWSYEDLKEMEDYSSFNMIWIRSQHYMFVTKMLPPLKNKQGKLYIGG